MQAERKYPASLRDSAMVFSDPRMVPSSQQRVHVVGVAGTGVRGLVHLLHQRGVKITGSEMLDSPVLETFRIRGIDCRVGHSSVNVDGGTNFVLISAAVSESNPEVCEAKQRSIPVLKYAQLLGLLMAEKAGIAVAGTHGKTTTTAMVSLVLQEAGLDPTFLIGGDYPGLGGSSRWGEGSHFVAEACEFDRSFLNLKPKISVVTNIEEDHLDYFHSLKDIQGAFADFVSLLPEDGYLVVNRDDPNSTYLSEFCRSRVGTFSLRPEAADWWAEDVVSEGGGCRFRIAGPDGQEARLRLRVPGIHNVLNALAATAVCRRVGVPLERIAQILETFTGVRRRFDILARGRVVVVDDYAHHPTEILAVLRAARESLRGRRLVAVFQPHQHSRLKVFREQFADVLARFDAAVVTDVYRARDKDEDAKAVQSDSLVRAINERRPLTVAQHAPRFADVLEMLRGRIREGDAVLFLGAGDITDLARLYADEARTEDACQTVSRASDVPVQERSGDAAAA
jgi:UDP-N-acetylmuramate--alanine ligase